MRPKVRRENKLALIIGFSVLLVVAVLVSDHLSQARQDDVGDGMALLSDLPDDGILFSAPLVDSERAAPSQPVRTAEASPARAEPERVQTAEASPEQTRLAGSPLPGFVPVPEEIETRADAPMVLANGPAAERAGSGDSRSGGLFDWDTSRIKALLETARSREDEPADAGEQPAARDGHVASAGVYVVQPGDSLYKICERLYGDGGRWHDLAAINEGRVGDNGTVYVGVTLKLLPGARTPQPAAARQATPPVKASGSKPESVRSAASSSSRRYTVRKGDTLSQIAQREVGSVRFLEQIRVLNPWLREKKDQVMVGQTLVLPAKQDAR
jgi:nucleoid-associated protein YgaU